jgi:hypothetical protein
MAIIVQLDVWLTKILVVQNEKILFYRVLSSGTNMVLRDLLVVLGITAELAASVLKEGLKRGSKDIYISRYGNKKYYWLRRSIFDEIVVSRLDEILSHINSYVSRYTQLKTKKHIVIFAGDFVGYIINKKLMTSHNKFDKNAVVTVV